MMRRGRLIGLGVGPGDPELLTVKAVKALEGAQAIAFIAAAGRASRARLDCGRAALAEYKKQRDPALAARMKHYQLVKYRLLRSLVEVPVLTRETFEEQITSDPLEKSKSQMMMF